MKVVGIGGGHGLARTLEAARLYAQEVTAVVTVADDGGSSGRLSTELGIPPPGDIRNCLVALSDAGPLRDLFQHRFSGGALDGHALGNLVIAALTQIKGDFAAAVEEAGGLIGARGTVLPASAQRVELRGMAEGGEVHGQVAVARSRSRIHSVHLEPPDVSAHPAAVRAIQEADQVILGPGSLFTSVIAALLVEGIRTAVIATQARKIFVCNTRPQEGETGSQTVDEHVQAVLDHLGADAIDAVVVHDPALHERFRWPSGVVSGTAKVIEADIAEASGRHDPVRLAAVLRSL